ncbi:MAG: hypothetical protein ACM3S4_05395 [Burkholderiales bacterium]
MKKAAALLVIVISLFLCSCVPEIVQKGGVVVRGERPKPTNIISYYKHEYVVYVTKSGTKYHNEDCPYLKTSKIMISLEQAAAEGKKPCSRCFGEE